MKKLLTILSLVCITGLQVVVVAQEKESGVLTLEQALADALAKNNNIQVAKNKTEIAKQQNTLGNAGYLPTLTANSNTNYGMNNSTLQFLNSPAETKFTGAQSFSYGTGFSLNYTIFGGLGAFYSHKTLKLNEENASIQERLNVEGIILQTIQAYCLVLQAQNNDELAAKSLEISKDRIHRAKTRFEIGGGIKLDLLNAEVDFNKDSLNSINTSNALETAKFRLNQLMNQEVQTIGYRVAPVLEQSDSKSVILDTLIERAKQNNASLLNSSYNSKISETQINLSRSPMLPRLSFQTNYNFNHSENDASILVFSESSGLSASIQLSIPIFDGHKKSIQYQNAKVQAQNAALSRLETESVMQRDLRIAFSNFEKAKSIASLDQKTIETAQLNFDRTKELFDSGQVSGLQFREAQLNLLRAQSQGVNNTINVKLAEVELMRLSGQLIQ